MDELGGKRPRRSRVRRPVKRKLVEDDGIEIEWDEREVVDGPPDQEEQSDG